MSTVTVANQICTYFGGAYDPTTRTYRTPQITVANLGGPIVRRGAPKHDDHQSDYFVAPSPGIPTGCAILVFLERGKEDRVAVAGASSGLKHVAWSVKMHCFLRSTVLNSEDVQDISYELLDAIRGHIEADRTLGTGGFEAGYGVGLQAGEGGGPWLTWEISPVSTNTKDLTKGYLLVEFTADQYIQA